MTLTAKQLRAIASMLIVCRRILIQKTVAELKGQEQESRRLYVRFRRTYQALPWFIQQQPDKYISHPATRQIEREGILSQNGRYTF